jgi:hypothetical protein
MNSEFPLYAAAQPKQGALATNSDQQIDGSA